MRIESKEIFREYEPPPGGVARFRAAIGSEKNPRGRRIAWLGTAAVAAITAAFVIVAIQRPAPDRAGDSGGLMAAVEFDRLLGRPSTPYELRVRRGDAPIEVVQLETANPKVRMFRLTEDSGR